MELPDPAPLEKARRHLDLSPTDLYVRYFSVGGVVSSADVDAYLVGVGSPLDPREHDKLVVALNECYLERGLLDRIPFLDP